MKKKKLKVIYTSLWDTATAEQKKEYQRRIDQVYDIIFEDIDLLSLSDQINRDRKAGKKSL